MKIQMLNLNGQYDKIKTEIKQAVISYFASIAFINSLMVKELLDSLEN
jgi:hypothetical protein